jgi:hypothetical protein
MTRRALSIRPYRAVLSRRLRAIAALVEAPCDDTAGGSMAGFSAELQKLISAGNQAGT